MNPGVVNENGDPLKGGGARLVKPGPPAAKLPSGFTANTTGNIIGPRGSVYNNTEKTDTAGNVIYSNNGGYYIFTGDGESSVSSPNPSNQIRQNDEQGKLSEDRVYQEHSADKSVPARDITVKTASGVNVRIDILSKDKQGNIACIECKSSPTAPLTPNQKIGFPEVEKVVQL